MSPGGVDRTVVRRHLLALDVALATLPQVFAERFRGIAGFRNVLVHGYLEVDLRIVEEMLASRLDDYREFARHLDTFLES
ncbi:MAG: HepT-like ribonuclease domain-containing protein [Thermoanaerobaculia bacterium]